MSIAIDRADRLTLRLASDWPVSVIEFPAVIVRSSWETAFALTLFAALAVMLPAARRLLKEMSPAVARSVRLPVGPRITFPAPDWSIAAKSTPAAMTLPLTADPVIETLLA
ncbi:hypothetical protein, partial [Rhizobium sp. BK289]|uniref:hypothetical protein n=1 Tax=Rhizobium sp. BK289 TaxID=2587079 RepID=UPI001AEF1564